MPDLRERLQATLHGTYQLDRELGGGGMARVFVAEELRLGRRVVVKVLSPELAAGLSAERFEREIRTAASLQQANIVPVLTAGETHGLPYYTMPFVEGESLRAVLARQGGPLPVSDVVRILGDVARALRYAHEHGVVHRDVKPDNVLLSGGTAVVTDFGIAKAISASRTGTQATLTQVGTAVGTPAYMAPEQVAGDPGVDHRADLYAFGCLGYELLVGRPPFHGRAPQQVLAAHLSEAPVPVGELRPEVPGALAGLVMRCLAKEPSERPQSAVEILAVLESLTSSGNIPAVSPVLLQGPGALRRALLAYALSVLFVAGGAQAATIFIGLPSWVPMGALLAMALGLPMILFTGYVQRVAQRAHQDGSANDTSRDAPGPMQTLALKAQPHVSWKRATRTGLYAASAFAVLVVAYMVLRAAGIGPVGTLLAAGKLAERDRLLITDFTVRGVDPDVAHVAAEGVRVGLGQSLAIRLMSPTDVAEALARMGASPTQRVDLDLAREIARREGVKAIVDGDVARLGQGLVVSIRLVSADSGTVLARGQATAKEPEHLVDAIDKVTRSLRERIGESLRAVRATPPLAQVTTASFDALSLYTQAMRLSELEGNDADAITLLRQAITLDSNFAMAWRKLGAAMWNQYYPPSDVQAALDRAFALRERLPERERLQLEASYYYAGRGRDRAKAIAAWEALLRRGDSLGHRINLAGRYAERREFARAEQMLRDELRDQPDSRFAARNLVQLLILMGRLDQADSINEELIRSGLGADPPTAYRRAMIPFLRGDVATYRRLLDSLVAAGGPEIAQAQLHSLAAQAAQMFGRAREHDELIQRANALFDAAGASPFYPIEVVMLSAIGDIVVRGDPERAVRRLDSTLAAHPFAEMPEPDRPYAIVAVAYAMAGRPDRARAILAQREAELTDTALARAQQPLVHRARAEIALAEGRTADAIREFRLGDQQPDGPVEPSPLFMLFGLGRAFDRAGMADSAIAAFEAFVAVPDDSRLRVDRFGRAPVHRRLGELYEARNDWERAAFHYATFVELWKDADPELQPQVAAVRARLTRERGE